VSEPRASDIAEVAARRAATVAGVARLDPGPFGTRATYGPSGRVEGVTVDAGETTTEVVVHAAVRYGEAIPPLGERLIGDVADALAAAFPGRSFSVGFNVSDIALPGEEGTQPALPPATPRRQLL
jgi:uncharacterized alkaline shock family protein YloU